MSQHPVPVPAYQTAALVALYDRFNPWGPADALERLAGGRIRVTQHYRFDDGTVLAHTDDLRFFALAELEHALAVSGLHIHTLYGDWQAGPFHSGESREMVLLVGHADGARSISSAG